MRFEDQRKLLVEELQTQGISDQNVLRAFASVPREVYVLPEYQEYAYRNQPLPIMDRQTISQPLMIAIMMQYLQLSADDIVLEVGTGSGYQTALLAMICREVCSIERLDTLSIKAQSILKEQGVRNAHFRIGDGTQGWIKAYPPYKEFSKIIISAGATFVPDGLTKQLAEGGLMVIPVGAGSVQHLKKISKSNGDLVVTEHGACSFVPLISEDGSGGMT